MTQHKSSEPSSRVSGTMESGIDQARELAAEVKENATRVAKDKTRGFAEARKQAAASYIEAIADAASTGGEELDKRGYGATSSAVGRVADDVRGVAKNLSERSARDLVSDLEGYAREHPAIFFGTAFVAGVTAARFFKSSGANGNQPSSSRASHTPGREQ